MGFSTSVNSLVCADLDLWTSLVTIVINILFINRINGATLERLKWSVVVTHKVWKFSVVGFQLSELLHLHNKMQNKIFSLLFSFPFISV